MTTNLMPKNPSLWCYRIQSSRCVLKQLSYDLASCERSISWTWLIPADPSWRRLTLWAFATIEDQPGDREEYIYPRNHQNQGTNLHVLRGLLINLQSGIYTNKQSSNCYSKIKIKNKNRQKRHDPIPSSLTPNSPPPLPFSSFLLSPRRSKTKTSKGIAPSTQASTSSTDSLPHDPPRLPRAA